MLFLAFAVAALLATGSAARAQVLVPQRPPDTLKPARPARAAVPSITRRLVAFGHRKTTGRAIDAIVVHGTYCKATADSFDIDCIIDQFRRYNVSAHYLIGRTGTIYQLVAEQDVSYHGGVGKLPDGDTRINSRTIGIEINNTPGTPPTQAQYEALALLVQDIERRHNIKFVVGHSQVAPDRKTDPWRFDWEYWRSLLLSSPRGWR